MNNKEVIEKSGISKKAGKLLCLQMVLVLAALFISLFGIFKSLDMSSINRLIVYGVQAAICVATVAFGVHYSRKNDSKYFRNLVLAYALLEAIRVSLLQTGEIGMVYSVLAKFVLALLVLAAALLAEKFEKKEGLYLALAMVGLEILLYIVFIVGFPGVRTSPVYMILPLVGILMAGSMCVFVTGRSEQRSHS